MSTASLSCDPENGPIVSTFLRYVLPSTLSLLAISTASVVDGFFVGNFIGADALASINLLMPYFALLFGVALMLAVGGSVKISISLSKKDHGSASRVFNQVFFAVLAMNLVLCPLALLFSHQLFAALGAPQKLFVLMDEYFSVLCLAMLIQLSGLVLYYFARADNRPELGMHALLLGAGTNIALDFLFIYGFGWGITAAAWATLLAQLVQLLYLLRHFLSNKTSLHFAWPGKSWSELGFCIYNGFSEFINEISIGIVILVFHWIISRQSGAEGIAAFSVVNYLIYISLMIYYGIVDAMHVLFSRNIGAGLVYRVSSFFKLAACSIAVLSLLQVVFLLNFQGLVAEFFLEHDAKQALALTQTYVHMIWPIFLFNGFNVLISAYLTSSERAMHSSIIALSRSLVLPIVLLVLLRVLLPDIGFIYAISVAEALTFVLALIFFIYFRPEKIMSKQDKLLEARC
ncbi:MATE family efflux transporter [Agaribacterium haliotis]|uniref:MATE family efflux transporter n=1 Tax=Agaribacterium haliotis TaxID=2013869 RepID=UPI000BB531BE|nr:MATE family efflux transporter [Agaribacterium haliotis]